MEIQFAAFLSNEAAAKTFFNSVLQHALQSMSGSWCFLSHLVPFKKTFKHFPKTFRSFGKTFSHFPEIFKCFYQNMLMFFIKHQHVIKFTRKYFSLSFFKPEYFKQLLHLGAWDKDNFQAFYRVFRNCVCGFLAPAADPYLQTTQLT